MPPDVASDNCGARKCSHIHGGLTFSDRDSRGGWFQWCRFRGGWLEAGIGCCSHKQRYALSQVDFCPDPERSAADVGVLSEGYMWPWLACYPGYAGLFPTVIQFVPHHDEFPFGSLELLLTHLKGTEKRPRVIAHSECVVLRNVAWIRSPLLGTAAKPGIG